METRKNTILKLIAIPFIMMAFTISMFFLCDSNVKAANDTTVVLKQDGQNVKVSLNPKEGASIASFQIGLKVEASKAADIKNVTFDWANIQNAKLKRESYDKEKGILNLYVVTEAEQNTGASIDVGTIKIETNKSTKVTVSPIADKTTASSIAHKDTKVDAKASEKITYTANTSSSGNIGDNKPGDSNKPGNSGNQGGNNSNQGGNNSGSGNTGNNGSSGNGSNSENNNQGGSNSEDNDDEDKNEENNTEDTNSIDNSVSNTDNSSNQVENIATGALPQAGEDDNFFIVWIFVALALLIGVLVIYAYRVTNRKNSFKL